MRICLIAEGSYPYVTGGVSSWIHSLMTSMPEHEFVIYAIAAERKQQGKFKYQLPPNLIELREVFLDAHLEESAKWGKRYNLTEEQQEYVKIIKETNIVKQGVKCRLKETL